MVILPGFDVNIELAVDQGRLAGHFLALKVVKAKVLVDLGTERVLGDLLVVAATPARATL